MTSLHFWTLKDCSGLDEWDPDSNPRLYLSGHGHSFMEMYIRLKKAGYPVTVGSDVPQDSDVVVAALSELNGWSWSGHPETIWALCRSLLTRRGGVAVIRNDVPLYVRSPKFVTLEVMPTHASVSHQEAQIFLPLLPQRGIIPRNQNRAPRISVVGLKAYEANVPKWIPMLRERLSEQAVELRVDTGRPGERPWEDFADIDAALCVHPDVLFDDRRKPPTKLINAWTASVIPICGSSVGYKELAVNGQDALFASNVEEIAQAIQRVNSDPIVAAALLENSARRGLDYSAVHLLPLWYATLCSTRSATWVGVARETVRCAIKGLAGQRLLKSVDWLIPRVFRVTRGPLRRLFNVWPSCGPAAVLVHTDRCQRWFQPSILPNRNPSRK